MLEYKKKKFSWSKLTTFVVLLDVFLLAFIFFGGGGNAALARDIFLEKAAGAFNITLDALSSATDKLDGGIAKTIYGLKIGTDKISEIKRSIFAQKTINNFESDSKLSLAGNEEDTKSIVDGENGIVLGEENTSDQNTTTDGQPSDGGNNNSQSFRGALAPEITARGVLAVLDHNLTYLNIAEHSVRRWNLNSNSVNSKKIQNYSIESHDLATDSVNSRIIDDHSVRTRDLSRNISIRGYFTVEQAAYFHDNVEITGDVSASTGTVVSLDGTTLIYATGNFTTVNLTTLDLGTNTLSDGNFTGNWNFNAGNLTGLGNLYPAANDTYDLGSDALRWRDVYLGGETIHIGTGVADEYTIGYDTTANRLEFNVNGAGSAEIVFDPNGNVGIGTTEPSNKLSVIGNAYFSGRAGVGAAVLSDVGVNAEIQAGAGEARTAVYASGQNISGSNATWIRGVMGEAWATGGGTIDSASGLEANLGTSAGSTIGTGYGIFINQLSGTVTHKFGLYQEGAGDINYFAGNVGVGTTNPANMLHIANSVNNNGQDILFQLENKGTLSTSSAMRFTSVANNDWWVGKNPDGTIPGYFGFLDNNGYKMVIGQGAGGNVGIGTTTPGYRLDIADSTTLRGLNIANSALNSYGLYSLGTKYGAYGSDGTTSGYLGYDDTYGLYTANNAYVGGTLTLNSSLTANGDILPDSDNDHNLGSATARWASLYLGPGSLRIYNTTGANAEYLTLGYTANVATLNLAKDAAGNYRDFALNQNGSEVMRVTGGNVGIGTTTPLSLLDIYKDSTTDTTFHMQNPNTGGNAFADIWVEANDSQLHLQTFGTTYTAAPDIANYSRLWSPVEGLILQTEGSGGIQFWTRQGFGMGQGNTRSVRESMRIDGSGNVGIGTTTPGQLLTVGNNAFEVSSAGAIAAAISTNTINNLIINAGALSGITTLSMNNQLTSTLAIGTAPFAVTSTTLNTNLNADQVDSKHATDFTLAYVTGNGATTTTQLGFNYNSGSPFTVLNNSVVSNLNADLLDGQHGAYYAPIASPTFTGTVTIPSPFTLGATSVTTTGTQLNYLNAATGMTGTTSTNLVFSTSPTLVTPVLGTPTSVTLTNADGTAASLTAGHVTNATLSTALTVNGGTLTLTADAANNSVLTIGAGAVSVSGSNTGDNSPNSSTMYIGTTEQALNRASAPEGLTGITGLTPGADFTLNQNSVAALTSVESGAIVNTLYLTGGNVGIGTTSPGAILEIAKSTGAALKIDSTFDGDVSVGDLLDSIEFASKDTNNGGDSYAGAGSAGTRWAIKMLAANGANSTHDLVFFRAWDNGVSMSSAEAMRLTYNGNVGIGTTTPSNNTLAFGGNSARSVGMEPSSSGAGNDFTVKAGGALSSNDVNGGNLNLDSGTAYGTGGSNMYFRTAAPGAGGAGKRSPSTKMTILGSGNVGIGTTTPGYVLDVGGGSSGYDIRGYDVYTHDGGVHSFSDVRLKNIEGNYSRGLDEIMALSPQYYHYKSANPLGLASQETIVGLMAQDVQKLIPEAVQMTDSGYLSMTQGPIFYAMLNAVKQQQGEISNAQSQGKDLSQGLTSLGLEFSSLNDQTVGLDDKLKIISASLAELDSQAVNLQTQLAQTQTKLKNDENNLLSFEASTNDLLNSMMDTEKALTEKVLDHEDRIKAIEDKIATLSVSCSGDTCPSAGEIPANVVTQDTQGNVILAGIFKAKDIQADTGSFKGALTADTLKVKGVDSTGVVAGAYAVKNDTTSAKNDTIGSGKILEVKKDADNDGVDDETGSDGKSAMIKNTVVKKDSKIFVTSRTMLDQPLVVTKIKDGESFTVEKKSPTNQDIDFDWWIIDQQ